MKKTWFLLAVLAVCVFLAVPAEASPNIYGATGLVRMPSSDVLGQGDFSLGLNVLEKNRAHAGFGVIPPLELGFTYYTNDQEIQPHIKYRFLQEDERRPGLAFGLMDGDLYVVGSKQLGDPRMRAHAGVGNGSLKAMLGFSYILNPVQIQNDRGIDMPQTTLLAEYVGEEFNIGVKMDFNDLVELSVATLGLDDLVIGVSLVNRF